MRWVLRWHYWIAAKPTKPGTWKLKGGAGYLVRGRALDPRTGKQRQVILVLHGVDATEAYARLQAELQTIRQGAPLATSKTRFASFAAQLQVRKIATGEIRSAKGREKWADALEHHLLPAFGAFFLQDLRRRDVEEWRTKMAARVGRDRKKGQFSPHTINTWISILRVIVDTAVAELELERSPMLGVAPLDVSEWATFTDEEPNSLKPADVPRFLETMLATRPQWYAMTALGMATGLRPSSLRPLRRKGATPDILFEEGVLLVRRSHTRGKEVMGKTKTGKNQRIAIPPGLVEILRWHVDTQLAGERQAKSDLLFPTHAGGLRSSSCLDKPFDEVAELIGVGYPITPKAMRRTFQDLARAAEIADVVARSVSGHATEAMQRRYSTVAPDEQRAALAKVVDLMAVRKAKAG